MEIETAQKRDQQIHIQALSATKLGDGLVDPKLVLTWLLTSLGAGTFWIGLLVPVREAGALLPQLFTAHFLRSIAVRKWWWITGSLVQGLAVLAIIYTALSETGDVAGRNIIIALSVFALARSVCSVSYKDVLGKTVEKPKRGLVTGTASSIAAGGVLVFGLLLTFQVIEPNRLVLGSLGFASALWFFAALRFTFLSENPSEIMSAKDEHFLKTYLNYLRTDKQLQLFLFARALLIATAIAPPFMILLARGSDVGILSQLGALVIASSFATFISGRVWGSLSDHSTPKVLGFAGVASAISLAVTVVGAMQGAYATVWFLPVVLFGVMVSYQGVRIARSIHLVNLANEDTRAAYTAISNTIIGLALLGTGVFGWLASVASVEVVMWLLVLMSLAGGLVGFTLKKP